MSSVSVLYLASSHLLVDRINVNIMAAPRPNFTVENNILKGEVKNVSVRSESIGDIILQVFNEKPNHVSQIDVATGAKTTYAQMKRACVSCALWLRKRGIGSADVVAVCTPNQPNDYVPVIASLLVGAVYNPWYHEVDLQTARHLMSLTRPKVAFTCASALNVLRQAARLENVNVRFVVYESKDRAIVNDNDKGDIYRLDEMTKASLDAIETFRPDRTKVDDEVAMILFSSGTTGPPKGVSYSCKAIKVLLNGLAIIPAHFNNLLWYSSLYWVSGTFCLLQTAVGSKTRILHANFDSEDTCRVIERFKVEWFFIPPSLVTHFCKAGVIERHKLESLKFFTTGGAKLGRDFIELIGRALPNVVFMQVYGMTEAGGVISMTSSHCERIDSVGFVSPNVQIKIADLESGEALGANGVGEICFKSPNVMMGYLRNPEATKEMVDDEGWYHTGDKGYYTENGELMIVDRLKEVMKYRGHQISPAELEEHLTTHEAVMEAAVVPMPHDLDLEVPMAFVKVVPGAKVTENELVEFSAGLGDVKRLRGGVVFLDEIPHTASGKLDRKLLKGLAKARKT